MTLRNTYLRTVLLTLAFFLICLIVNAQHKLIINEVSQGSSAKEYVELLVMGTPSCGGSNCMDLRGYYIDDNNGFYATGGSVGIAQGIVRFTQDPVWECVPLGTLIVIYNENDVNGSLPPDDLSLADGNCRLILPSNDCSLFERHTTLPSGSNSTIPTSGFIPCGSWNSLAMSNGGDSFQVINPNNLTSAEFAVSYANNQNNTLIYFNVTMGNSVIYNANLVDNNPYNQNNWTYGAIPANETPGLPNNAANSAWISQMNNNCSPFPIPLINSTHTNATCNCNGTATVSVIGGLRPFTYSWSGGTSSIDSTANNLCAGTYTVTVTTADGCELNEEITITSSSALSATTSHTNVTCNGSSDGTASVNTSGGSGILTYAWNPPVSTGNTANDLSPGTYTVTISEPGGCEVINDFIVTQPQKLTLQTALFDATCFNLCNGQAVVAPAGGTTPFSFSWSASASILASANDLCAGQHCVTVTDANGCVEDTCIMISQPTDIVLSTQATNAICFLPNGSASVSATGGNGTYTYSWDNGTTTNAIVSITPGTYCMKVTDMKGCVDSVCIPVGNTSGVTITSTSTTNVTCFGDCDGSATIVASGGDRPYTYSWPAISSIDSLASSLCADDYIAIVTDASGCKDTASITVSEPQKIITSPQVPVTICIGQSTILTSTSSGGTGNYSYTWSPEGPVVMPDTTTEYFVMASDENGCTSELTSVLVTVFPELNVNITSPLPVCDGGTAILTPTVSGGNGNYSYSWTPSGTTGPTYTLSPVVEGTYSVIVSDGCTIPSDTASVIVVINNSSPVEFTSTTSSGCIPICVTLTDNTAGSINSTWSVDGITKTGRLVEYCFEDSGTFDVTLAVQGANGCSGTLTKASYIKAYAVPEVSFTTTPEKPSILIPEVDFLNTSSGASTYEWIFNDSIYSTENFSYTFTDTGCFNITLKGYTLEGCVDSITEEICIKEDFVFYIPNAFTPNGDGLNDYFGPISLGILTTDFLFQIYDRWGNLVYETSDPLKPWNGKSNKGSSVSTQDTYVYKIKLADMSGNARTFKGKVTIVK